VSRALLVTGKLFKINILNMKCYCKLLKTKMAWGVPQLVIGHRSADPAKFGIAELHGADGRIGRRDHEMFLKAESQSP